MFAKSHFSGSPSSNMDIVRDLCEELSQMSKNKEKVITHEEIKNLYWKFDTYIWDTILYKNGDIKYRIDEIARHSFEKGLEIGRGCPDAKRVTLHQASINTNLRELNIILETTDDSEEDSEWKPKLKVRLVIKSWNQFKSSPT